MKVALPLAKNVLRYVAKSVLIPLGLVAEALAANSGMHKIVFGLKTTVLITWNEEMNDVMKTAESLEDPGLLIKGVSETIENEAEEKNVNFLVSFLVQVY